MLRLFPLTMEYESAFSLSRNIKGGLFPNIIHSSHDATR